MKMTTSTDGYEIAALVGNTAESSMTKRLWSGHLGNTSQLTRCLEFQRARVEQCPKHTEDKQREKNLDCAPAWCPLQHALCDREVHGVDGQCF